MLAAESALAVESPSARAESEWAAPEWELGLAAVAGPGLLESLGGYPLYLIDLRHLFPRLGLVLPLGLPMLWRRRLPEQLPRFYE